VVQAEAAFASKDYPRAASFFAKVNFLLLNLIQVTMMHRFLGFCYIYLISYE
jgi:hypothetical protein